MDLLDPLWPLVSIVHRSQEVFPAISCISTELLRIDSVCPTFACPCARAHRSTLLMISSLLLQQYLVRLIWIVFMMGGRWPYSCCFVGCCHQLFSQTPFRIQWIVKICDVMDQFLLKPFLFFLSISSILGSMQFCIRAL